MRRIMIGTAGHIDHGKTSLVRVLTGIDTDRLPEEKQRGMTIDLGFAPLFVEPELTAGLVDVPGHERFIRNMVAGASGIDLVLFVVAADDGVMPQTVEHLRILELLGIDHGVVAVTKIDAVDPEYLELQLDEIRTFLRGTFLEKAPLFPVSSVTRNGVPELKQALRQAVDRVSTKRAEGIFRLPIQRVFAVKGFGTVVTGIPFSGQVAPGEPVEILPKRLKARVRGIQAYGKAAEHAEAGHSVSLNLTEVEHTEVKRGDVVATPGFLHPVTRLEVKFRFIGSGLPVLKDLSFVRLHVGTAEAVGTLVLVGCTELRPGEEAFVQLRLAEPIVAAPGDRFVLRLETPLVTLGGGTVIGLSDRRLHRQKEGVVGQLKAMEASLDRPEEAILALASDPARLPETAELERRTLLGPSELAALLAKLSGGKMIRKVRGGKKWIASARWDELAARIAGAVEAFHRRQPLQVGIERVVLREQLKVDADLFQDLLEALVTAGTLREQPGGLVQSAGFTGSLSKEDETIAQALEERFRAGGFAPPAVEEVLAGIQAPAGKPKKVLDLLVQRGTLVKVKDGIVFHREAVDRAKMLLVQAAEAQGEVESGKFRDQIGTSRKYVIPLLEHFDAQGLTKRVGNKRFLRKFSR